MNVSPLPPWLSDSHTVRFSGSSGYFLFLNLLLSFFWLCEEAKCIYLHLHLGQKSNILYNKPRERTIFLELCEPCEQHNGTQGGGYGTSNLTWLVSSTGKSLDLQLVSEVCVCAGEGAVLYS